MRRHLWSAILLAILICLTGFFVGGSSAAVAADPPNQPFDLIYSVKDVKYRIYQDGVGMLNKTEGTLIAPAFNGPGIVKAYLVWAGLGRDADGVLMRRDAEPDVRITPGLIWNRDTFGGQPTWGCCGEELTVYATDITDLGIALTGNHTYTVSDMEITHTVNGEPVVENWGFSLLLVYDDPTLDRTRDIVIKLGNDGLFSDWTGLLGPNSDVQCFSFESNGLERRANFSVVVGGVENATRPNALWGMASSENYVDPNVEGGTWTQNSGLINLPPNIVGVPGSTQLDGPFADDSVFPDDNDTGSPFRDRNGDEWDEYQRFDVMIDPTDEWVCVQVESATQQNRPDLPAVVPGTTINRSASIGFLGFIALIENVGADPEIDIVKFTNGQDANDPDGTGVPVVAPGDDVTWTYAVTNVGDVDIPEADITVTDSVEGDVTQIIDKGDGDAILSPAETWVYQLEGTAINTALPPAGENLTLVDDVCTQDGAVSPPSTAYTNVGTVTIPSKEATDPSSYCNPGSDPAIDIIKFTNGQDANDPDGTDVPVVAPGDDITWTYAVTNVGDVDIPEADITVTDSVEGDVTQIIDKGDGDAILSPAETWVYQLEGTAINTALPPAGENLTLVDDVCTQDGAVSPPSTAYTNVGTVTIPSKEATDPSSYCNPGSDPAIDIIKFTNGQDANDPDGVDVPIIQPTAQVIWTYAVTNVGVIDIPEADITVTDSIEGDVTQIIDKADGDDTLTPNETWVYELRGTAIDLTAPPSDPNLVIVDNVCTLGGAIGPASSAYTNVGTVTIPTMSATDPSSYCGPTGNAIDEPNVPARPDNGGQIFMPLLRR